MDFHRFEAITFDCYGTLIDWEIGIAGALTRVLKAHDITLEHNSLLARYAEQEAACESRDYMPYREVLHHAARGFFESFGFLPNLGEENCLVESFQHWEPFEDTVKALKALHRRYKLGIISNVDDDLFAVTAAKLREPFDRVITAEQAHSYKPSHRNFELAIERMSVPKEHILHVAQSLYHDIAPARELGISCVHVVRYGSAGGYGASPPAHAAPNLTVPDLAALTALITQSM